MIQPYYTNNNMIGIRFYEKGSIICDKQSLDLSIKLGLIVGELIKNVVLCLNHKILNMKKHFGLLLF